MSLPKWARAPKTLKVAIHRLEVIRQHVYWLEHDLEGSRSNNDRLREEISHLERILTTRWNANDARKNGAPCDPECSICAQTTRHREIEAAAIAQDPKPLELAEDHLDHIDIFRKKGELDG